MIRQIEDIPKSEWPLHCEVCHHERGLTVTSKSRKAALKHRNREHPWLAQHLAEDKGKGL